MRWWAGALTESASGGAPRAAAARAVTAVLDGGRNLEHALEDVLAPLSAADRSLASMLARETVRWHRLLAARLEEKLKNKKIQPILRSLLEIGVLQLDTTRVPPHAAVAATVTAAEHLGIGRARGLVNAVLRGHQRAQAAVVDENEAVTSSLPDWLFERIRTDWPDDWHSVLAAMNQPAPMWLRNNVRAQSRLELEARLAKRGIQTSTSVYLPDGLSLAESMAADDLPDISAGSASIQDGGAQLAADVVDLSDGMRVLDACSAPGNKAAHLIERGVDELIALEHDSKRLETLQANFARLGITARGQVTDAADPQREWWDGAPFDRILVDAPCSGTGVIRRHPDIKWLRRPRDVERAAKQQLALLRALWPALASGGMLVFATCSILRAEGAEVVARFRDEQSDAVEMPIEAGWGRPELIGRRVAPGDHGFDGFFYARLVRRQSP